MTYRHPQELLFPCSRLGRSNLFITQIRRSLGSSIVPTTPLARSVSGACGRLEALEPSAPVEGKTGAEESVFSRGAGRELRARGRHQAGAGR